jgi:UDP-4-amino-4,6-dideoxy-N-acetyl-beta-L-altrosamine transaminase
MIPYGRQQITEADVEAVSRVLRSDFLTQGDAVPEFEHGVASRVNSQYAVATCNATAALHIACLALGLNEQDRLWTVPNTFVATANCGRYCGAKIDFVDINPETWNIDVRKLQEKLLVANRQGVLPKIIVPVHFAGQPTEQEAIWQLAQEFGVHIIEDGSHSIGASRNGEPVGSCRWSDICVFSFHPVKIITTGEGGMATTNSEDLAERMRMLRSHGITRDPAHYAVGPGAVCGSSEFDPKSSPWYYEQVSLGFNYRMTDIQAALGSSQLGRLSEFIERRSLLARRYTAMLQGLPLKLPVVKPGYISSFHLYAVRLKRRLLMHSHRAIFAELRRRGIGVNLHYMPVYLQPYYRQLGFGEGTCPEAEAYANEAITLPLYPSLTEAEQDFVVETLKELLH